ncbi:hypothetical protein HID58_095586 [Brassica napus]|uniref:Uncharacterized protein n=1 Tax=Brassica napus TaxID=3708 RepID=A0ABQ7X355_BRANA|nr:hypothetical protein HID58_095586 [Brassica napus]
MKRMLTHKSGKLEIQSPADEFIKYFIRKNHVSFFYAAEDLRFEILSEDVASRTVTVTILGTLISKSYKMVTATFTVAPREEDITKSCLEYTFEFDDINNYIGKTVIVESLLTYILISDGNNIKGDNFKYNSFDAGYPAEECFKRYVNEFSDDDDVRMENAKKQKRIFTVSFRNAPNLADDMYDDDEITVTITPKKGDNNRSCVKWTIKVEKVDDNKEESGIFLIKPIISVRLYRMLTHKSGKRYLVSPADEFINILSERKAMFHSFMLLELRFEIVSEEDVAERTVTMNILGTLISEGYKTVKVRITVAPWEEEITKSCLEYTFEFDKIKNHIRKTEIVESLLTYIDISDTNNNRSDDNLSTTPLTLHSHPNFFLCSPKDDVTVGDVNRINKRFTVSFISAPFLSDSYEDGSIFQSMEVTITITPKKDNSRSRVKWTIKVEKFDYSKEQADFFFIAADHIRETIMAA